MIEHLKKKKSILKETITVKSKYQLSYQSYPKWIDVQWFDNPLYENRAQADGVRSNSFTKFARSVAKSRRYSPPRKLERWRAISAHPLVAKRGPRDNRHLRGPFSRRGPAYARDRRFTVSLSYGQLIKPRRRRIGRLAP